MKKCSGRVISLLLLVICIVFNTCAFAASEASNGPGVILVADLNGVVGLPMENFSAKVLALGEEENALLILFRIDTPGGLASSMRAITNAILSSPVPVVVWVSPSGARAASAGAFIVQSASVAVMVPGTNIGAAHPVKASGSDVESTEMNKKVTNDLAAQIRSLAQLHDRNSETAAKMVTDSISLTAKEALDAGVIDLIASDREKLINNIDGRSVFVNGEKKVLSLHGGYEIKNVKLTPRETILQFISSPTVAYLLLTIGIYAIILEVLSPGGFVMGTSGVVMMLLGAYGLRMLPVNWAGIILLVAGIAVMVIDLFVGGIGILSLFGMAAMVVGSMVAFRAPGGELLNVSLNIIVGVAIAVSIFSLMAAALVMRTLRKKPASGKEGLMGLPARAVEDIAPEGMVRCRGELWKARTAKGTVKKGESGKVVAIDGLVLVIEPSMSKGNFEEAKE